MQPWVLTLQQEQHNNWPNSCQDIASGKELITPIPETTGAMVWANDNATLVRTSRCAVIRSVCQWGLPSC